MVGKTVKFKYKNKVLKGVVDTVRLDVIVIKTDDYYYNIAAADIIEIE